MRPYFENPVAGGVLLVVVLCWLLMEFIEFLRVQQARASRPGVAKTRNPAGRCRLAAAWPHATGAVARPHGNRWPRSPASLAAARPDLRTGS